MGLCGAGSHGRKVQPAPKGQPMPTSQQHGVFPKPIPTTGMSLGMDLMGTWEPHNRLPGVLGCAVRNSTMRTSFGQESGKAQNKVT